MANYLAFCYYGDTDADHWLEPKNNKLVSLYLVLPDTSLYGYNTCGTARSQLNVGPPDSRGDKEPANTSQFQGGIFRVQ